MVAMVPKDDGGEHAGKAQGAAAAKDAARHVYGPRPIGALLPRVTRPAFRQRSAAVAQIMSDWGEIVGPALAAVSSPRRVSAGTLTLACSGPIALELQHLAVQLAERINAHLGRVVVQRLRFVQETPASSHEAPLPRTRASKPVEVPGVADGPLRDALAALGAAIEGAGSSGAFSPK